MIIETKKFTMNAIGSNTQETQEFETRSLENSEEDFMEYKSCIKNQNYESKNRLYLSPDIEEYHTNILKCQLINKFFKPSLSLKNAFRKELFFFAWKLCKKLEYSMHTYHLSIAYIDVIMYHFSISESQKEICAYVSVLTAAKFQEKNELIPTLKDSVIFFENNFSDLAFMHYEQVILECLCWQLNIKTPYVFLDMFLSKQLITEEETMSHFKPGNHKECMSAFHQLSNFFLDICIQDYSFNEFNSDVFAISSIVCVRRCLNMEAWNSNLERLFRVEWNQIENCVFKLIQSTKRNESEIYKVYSVQLEHLNNLIKINVLKKMKENDRIAKFDSENSENKSNAKHDNTSETFRKEVTPQNENTEKNGKNYFEKKVKNSNGAFFEDSIQKNTIDKTKKKENQKRLSSAFYSN